MKTTTTAIFLLIFSAGLYSQDPRQNVLRLAQAFEQQGEYERAIQMYNNLFATDTTNYVYFEALRRMFVQMKRYDDAITLSLRRLRSVPLDVALQSNIGSLYSMAGNEQKADSVWNSVLQSSNKNQMVFRAVASEQMNQRLFDRAIATYLRGRKESGDKFVFANELGYLYSFTMDYTNTTREYLRMLRQNDQQFDFVQSRLALLVARPEGLRSCIAVVEEELNVQQTIPLMRLQTWMYMEANRYTDAFMVTETLERLINSNGQELFTFAERVFRENEFFIAAKAYQQSIQYGTRMPFVPAAKFGYARCVEELSVRGTPVENVPRQNNSLLETQPSFSGAINLYSSIAGEYPFSAIRANALYRIGWIRYKQLFDLDGALQMFDSVMISAPVGPMVPTVLETTGEIFIAQNKLDAASKKFLAMSSSSYSTPEQRTDALFRLAELQFFKNNFDSVLTLLTPLTENLKTDESNDALLLQYFVTENKIQFPEAIKQYAHAELLARQNKLSEAIQELSSIIDIYPTSPLADDVLLKKAEYSILLKQYNEALSSYEKLLTEYKESIEKDKTQFKIGELYQYHLLDKQKAIAAYEVILEKYPFSLFTEQARKRIRQIRGDSI
jgi:tetratricopeptide (TPR) repeat protein